MEVKNKDIFSNLNYDEEIVYVVEKASKFEFYFFNIPQVLVILFLFAFLSIFIVLTLYKPYNENYYFIIFLSVLLIFSILMLYKEIVDYFFTDIVLTNQRLIIFRLNKFLPISYSQIKYIQNAGTGRGLSATKINLINKKFYVFFFLDHFNLRSKLKEIYPSYDDTIYIEKDQKIERMLVIILAFLPLLFLIGYAVSYLK